MYSSLGNPLDIILNIILMFIITLFPILTKLMAEMHSGILLTAIYLGCYGIMDILILILQFMANRKSMKQRVEEFQTITGYIELLKDKIPNKKFTDMHQKIELIDKYIDDPATFNQLYQEFITTLPEHIQIEIRRQEQIQRMQSITVVVFYVIAFLSVFLSVLTIMVNPYYCYLIMTAAGVLFGICKLFLNKQEGRFVV